MVVLLLLAHIGPRPSMTLIPCVLVVCNCLMVSLRLSTRRHVVDREVLLLWTLGVRMLVVQFRNVVIYGLPRAV